MEIEKYKQNQLIYKTQRLAESIDSFLKPLVSKVNSHPEYLLDHADIPTLAAQIAGLLMIGSSQQNRETHNEFKKLDGEKFSSGLYKFLSNINEPHSERGFGQDTKITADAYLVKIGKEHYADETKRWEEILTKAKEQDEESLTKLKDNLTKLEIYYKATLQKLKDHFDQQELEQRATTLEV
jgi:hypothetical protein